MRLAWGTSILSGLRALCPAPWSMIGICHRVEYQSWQVHHWTCLCPVLFTNESRFPLSTCHRHERVGRSRGERYSPCNIIQHHRFDGGSVRHIHGGMQRPLIRLSNGTLTAIRYRDEPAGAVGPGFLLVHSNTLEYVPKSMQAIPGAEILSQPDIVVIEKKQRTTVMIQWQSQ